jgi:hypothetical protein
MNISLSPVQLLTTTTTPVLPTTAPLPPEPTPACSLNPSYDEWEVQNDGAYALVIQNILNPIGLGVVLDGTATDAWKSLIDAYEIINYTALINMEQDLCNTMWKGTSPIHEHLIMLCECWAHVNAMGANIVE